jgi:hypothetical protein
MMVFSEDEKVIILNYRFTNLYGAGQILKLESRRNWNLSGVRELISRQNVGSPCRPGKLATWRISDLPTRTQQALAGLGRTDRLVNLPNIITHIKHPHTSHHQIFALSSTVIMLDSLHELTAPMS